jgi:hypothetical protein
LYGKAIHAYDYLLCSLLSFSIHFKLFIILILLELNLLSIFFKEKKKII